MAINKNQFRFVSSSGLDVIALRGRDAPYISGGYGGWQIVSRMRRVGLTQYVGVDPIRIIVPILFDGWGSGESQEMKIKTLERMARPAIGGGEPPTVRVYGGIPRPDITSWLIEDLDYSSQQDVIWDMSDDGVPVRFRQDLVVHLVEQVDQDRVETSSLPGVGFGPGGAPSGRPKPHHAFHIVKPGETLAKISTEEYGSPKYVRDILAANKLRDAKAIKPKQKLRMP